MYLRSDSCCSSLPRMHDAAFSGVRKALPKTVVVAGSLDNHAPPAVCLPL